MITLALYETVSAVKKLERERESFRDLHGGILTVHNTFLN